jgi:hypothetical protein
VVPQHLDVVAWYTPRPAIAASHADLGERYLYCEGDVPLLFTENETNNERLFGTPNASRYAEDGINNYVVNRIVER